MNTLRFKAEQIYRIVKKLQSLKSFRISPVMSCPYLTISHFTVPCDLGWDSKNTHHSVNTVHDSEKRDSVKSFHPAVKNLPVSTTIENPYSKTGLYGCFCQKELRWTEKYMYQVYFGTVVHLVRVVHVFSGHFHFSRKRPLQKLDADESSGKLPTADIDLICIFKVIVVLVLFEIGAKALL